MPPYAAAAAAADDDKSTGEEAELADWQLNIINISFRNESISLARFPFHKRALFDFIVAVGPFQ